MDGQSAISLGWKRIQWGVKKIKVSHVLLCLWLVPSHLLCLLQAIAGYRPPSPTTCAPKLVPAFVDCTTPSTASPAEPAIKPDVIIWYIHASIHRRQREPTTPFCHLHKPSAALPAGPTPDALLWYVHTFTESTTFTNHTDVFSVRSCRCITVCTICLLTDSHLIETVLNAADLRLHFAVKECVKVVIALSTWQITWRVQRWPLDPGQRCSSAQRNWMML